PVIFVTAHDAFALQAFDVHALDYVMKPFPDRRLREALDRARKPAADLTRRLEALIARLDEPRFEVRLGKRVLLVSSSQLDWVDGASYYAVLHAGEATHLVRETLNEIEARLDPARFMRVHRSAIVRLDRIRELRPKDRGLVLHTGARVRVSRS